MLWIPRGFVIPCLKDGRIHRVRIRRPAGDLKTSKDVKYYVLPGSGMEVMSIAPEAKTVVVVEAELDAMLVGHAAGRYAGVVALGSAATKPGSSVYYELTRALRILVALDYDEAGQKAWAWWREHFPNARLWPVPQGKDPGEAFEKGVDILAWVRAGLPPAALMTAQDLGYTRPAGLCHMEELRLLLNRYRVRLRANMKEFRILYTPGFKNQVIKQRIQELAVDDEEVHWYLRYYHPADEITGNNCAVEPAVHGAAAVPA